MLVPCLRRAYICAARCTSEHGSTSARSVEYKGCRCNVTTKVLVKCRIVVYSLPSMNTKLYVLNYIWCHLQSWRNFLLWFSENEHGHPQWTFSGSSIEQVMTYTYAATNVLILYKVVQKKLHPTLAAILTYFLKNVIIYI